MALIGEGAQGVPIDYGRWAQMTAQSSQAAGAAIGSLLGKFEDMADQRKKDKETVKKAQAQGKAVQELFGDKGGFLDSFLAGIGDEELPISERAAMASGMNDLIAAGIDKFNTDRDFGLRSQGVDLQRQQLEQQDRQFNTRINADAYAAQTEQKFDQTSKLNEAATRFIAAKDSEKDYKGKLPELETTDTMINSLLDQGQGDAALSLVKAREDQVAKYLANNESKGKTLTNIAVPGGSLDVFLDPQTQEITDLYGNPINTEITTPDSPGVLPARPDANEVPAGTVIPNRVPERAPIGFKPAAQANQQTPAQARKEQLEIQKLEGDLSKQAADVAIAQRSNDAAVEKGRQALESLREIRNHPGRWAATGKTGVFPSMPGSDANDFDKKLEKAKALAGTIGIEAMRGLGAMSEKEFAAAQASIAQLDKTQKTETIEKELDSLIKLFESKIGEAATKNQSPQSAQDRLRTRVFGQ